MDMDDLRLIAKKTIGLAQEQGVDAAEAYAIKSWELSIDVREQTVETLKQAEDKGLGLRVIKDGRKGYAYTTDFSPAELAEIVRQAAANSQNTAEDQSNILPQPPQQEYMQINTFDREIEQRNIEEKIQLAKRTEQAAKNVSPLVSIVESASYFDAGYQEAIVSTTGIDACSRGNYCGLYISLVAEENQSSQSGFAVDYSLSFAGLDPGKTGRQAADNALRMLGAEETATKNMPVVFEPYSAVNLLGLLAPALTAEAVQKGRSLLAGKMGSRVASELITLVDDGCLAGGINSAPFDGEGVPTSCTVLIDKGILKNYLYNSKTAFKDGVASTGNGVRGSFKREPGTGITNFYFEPGLLSREQLLAEIKEGLYVTELMGMHTANPISGDFSVGAAGILINNGRLTRPVKGLALADNIIELLKKADAVADDLQFFGGSGSPTIRISSMMVSGT